MAKMHLIRLRLNDRDHQNYMQKVERSGLSQSAFMRSLLNNAVLHERPCEHHTELLSTLSDISNGVNEILRRSRSGDALTEQDAAELRRIMTDTWRIVSDRY